MFVATKHLLGWVEGFWFSTKNIWKWQIAHATLDLGSHVYLTLDARESLQLDFFFFFFCSEFFQQAAALPLFLGLFEHFLWIPGSRPGDVQTLRILFPWNGFPPCPILIRILNCVKVLHFTSRGHCLTLSEVLTEKPLI